ncbi:ABC-type phosphate transport system permease subunit [Edaphobacter lichenicola]|uniref:ABC-type phosphate transport system permease subunit n=1 Tax=Tunturiibacter lichenicola TaxID=2051959 RepID=A0A852VCS5_9BACT|nr:ABC-type phosphate transport system permease subunit [Edaphobacter lichenicola]
MFAGFLRYLLLLLVLGFSVRLGALVKTTGYILFMAAFVVYAMIWQAIWQLVSENRQAYPDKRFGRFWWAPAWRVHRNSYPSSNLRRQIVMLFMLTFALLCAAMVCIGYSMLHATQR